MQNTFMTLTCALLFSAGGVSGASALDPPDIVYIDGQPCNSACRSYMAWSRQIMPMPGESPSISPAIVAAPKSVARRARIRGARSKPPANDHSAKRDLLKAKITNSQPAGKAGAIRDTSAATPADSLSMDETTAHFGARTISAQVAAAVEVAERITAAMATPPGLEDKTNIFDSSSRPKSALSNDKDDPRTAVIMVRFQISSVSDLTGQEVAVEGKLSAAASGHVRTAIATAGAAEVRLAESQGRAIDRVISGEVSAAVLTLASPEAAEMFPEIVGFRIFRIPLSPRWTPTKTP